VDQIHSEDVKRILKSIMKRYNDGRAIEKYKKGKEARD